MCNQCPSAARPPDHNDYNDNHNYHGYNDFNDDHNDDHNDDDYRELRCVVGKDVYKEVAGG